MQRVWDLPDLDPDDWHVPDHVPDDWAPAGEGGPGPDIGPLANLGIAWATLRQDGTDYFDLHHTPDDTLDKINPAALAQNVAAYAVFAYLAAEAEGTWGSAPKPTDSP